MCESFYMNNKVKNQSGSFKTKQNRKITLQNAHVWYIHDKSNTPVLITQTMFVSIYIIYTEFCLSNSAVNWHFVCIKLKINYDTTVSKKED